MSPSNDSPIGVIFDMDGVLVDSAESHLESWRRLAGELGRQISGEQFTSSFGQTSRDIIAQWFGVSDSVEARRLDDRKEHLYRELIRDRVPVMRGAVEVVQRLCEGGFRIAIGSSGPPENVDLVCRAMELTPYLSAVVTGRDVQRGKPDPQVFECAAERLGLIAAQCVVVEDAPSGIEAAHRARMPCIALVGSHGRAGLAQAEGVIESLDEITCEWIRGLVRNSSW